MYVSVCMCGEMRCSFVCVCATNLYLMTAYLAQHPWERYIEGSIEEERALGYPSTHLNAIVRGENELNGVHTVVFNHNPKAAGTFIMKTLRRVFGRSGGLHRMNVFDGTLVIETETETVRWDSKGEQQNGTNCANP